MPALNSSTPLINPPHREAICLEPYTCTTDAINLQQQGVNAGLISSKRPQLGAAGVQNHIIGLKR